MSYRGAWTAVWKKYPDDRLFYSLCLLGGTALSFTFMAVFGRFPTDGETLVIAVAMFVWLKLVTLPYLDARMETLEQATLREEREAREKADARRNSGKDEGLLLRIPGIYRLVVYLRSQFAKTERAKGNARSDLGGIVNVHGPDMSVQV